MYPPHGGSSLRNKPGEAGRKQERAPKRSGGRRRRLDRNAGQRQGCRATVGAHREDVLLLQHHPHFQGRAVLRVLDGLDQFPTELGEEVLVVAELLVRGSPVPERRLQAEEQGRGAVFRDARSWPEPPGA